MELTELQKHWEEFGKTDPLWAILSQPDKKQGGWNPNEFFRAGQEEVDDFLTHVEKLGHRPRFGSALDFGCGVGRLTQSLCRYFVSCKGVDIATSMVEHARKFNRFGIRCKYYVNPADDLRLFPDNSFDLVYSNIVLQHMEPRYSRRYIQEFIRVLKPGGITYFQLASEPDEAGTPECPAVPLTEFQANLSLVSLPSQFRSGKPSLVRVRVRNISNVPWPGRGKMRVRLANHWRSGDGSVLSWDDGRKDLPSDVTSGAECVLDLRVLPPDLPEAVLDVDLLQEHVTWFGDHGSPTVQETVAIHPASSQPEGLGEIFQPTMELHGVPVAEVKQLLEEAGATVLDAQEDGWAGPDWLSYHYVARKR